MPVGRLVRGRGGRTLADVWDGSPHAHMGATVPGFPNLFMLLGPNTGLGHSSMVYMIESQIAYVMDALRAMRETGAAIVEVKPEAERAYNEEVRRRMQGTVWETRLHELVPGREGQHPDALARLDVALPAPHRPLRPIGVRAGMKVIITGAAGGIGTATAAALRRQGATVVGLDLTGADIDCDVRDQAAVDRAVAAAIERLGGLDVLINNAGVGTPQSAGAPRRDALDVLAVNLLGPWRVTARRCPRCAPRAGA